MSEEARAAQELMGLPVLTIGEGKNLGSISRLLVRRETRSLVAVGIGGGAFSHTSYLRYSQAQQDRRRRRDGRERGGPEGGDPAWGDWQGWTAASWAALWSPSTARSSGRWPASPRTPPPGRIEAFRVRPEVAGLARLAALAHLHHPEIAELPDALVLSLGDSALIVRDEATSLWQHDPPAQSAPAPDDLAGSPTA